MSRRKHLMQQMLHGETEPPEEGQDIVKAVGSRGSNIFEVEFADGRRTLCLLPAKFHKKIWIKRGTYLIIQTIESSELGDSAITGQITQVLYADHVKQLKRMVGVWPAGFDVETAAQGDTSDRISAALSSLEISSTKTESKGAKSSDSSTSSDDDLPPRIENRRIVVYEASDADSDD